MNIQENLRFGKESAIYHENSQKPGIIFGSYLPQKTLCNEEIASWKIITESGRPLTADAILQKTGIKQRHIADAKETPFFMAAKASQEALRSFDGKVDAVIVSTSFPTGENTSAKIMEEFGLSGFHLDIHAACSGVGLSLALLFKYRRFFQGKNILFVTSEKYSPHLQDLRNGGTLKDPSLAQTIFSDGAFACVFQYGRDLDILSIEEHKFSEEASRLIKMPIDRKLMIEPFIAVPIPYPTSGKFEQEGSSVYKEVRKAVPDLIRHSVKKAGLTPEEIKMVFLHQGSGHMVTGVNNQLKEFGNRVFMDFESGNLSSGSIPKGFLRASGENIICRNDAVNLTVFGAGMRAISTTIKI